MGHYWPSLGLSWPLLASPGLSCALSWACADLSPRPACARCSATRTARFQAAPCQPTKNPNKRINLQTVPSTLRGDGLLARAQIRRQAESPALLQGPHACKHDEYDSGVCEKNGVLGKTLLLGCSPLCPRSQSWRVRPGGTLTKIVIFFAARYTPLTSYHNIEIRGRRGGQAL